MMQGMLLEVWMITRDMGCRCDRWEPRGRPEPTSTVHAQKVLDQSWSDLLS